MKLPNYNIFYIFHIPLLSLRGIPIVTSLLSDEGGAYLQYERHLNRLLAGFIEVRFYTERDILLLGVREGWLVQVAGFRRRRTSCVTAVLGMY